MLALLEEITHVISYVKMSNKKQKGRNKDND